jgi:hypothetical protein
MACKLIRRLSAAVWYWRHPVHGRPGQSWLGAWLEFHPPLSVAWELACLEER